MVQDRSILTMADLFVFLLAASFERIKMYVYIYIRSPVQSIEWFHFLWPSMTLIQISRARYYSTLNTSETCQIDTWLLQTTVTESDWIVLSLMTFISSSRSFQLFLSQNKRSLLLRSLIESSGNRTKDDTADDHDLMRCLQCVSCLSVTSVDSVNG